MGMSNDKLIDLGWPFGGLCKMNLVIWVHVSGDEHHVVENRHCRTRLRGQELEGYMKNTLFFYS